MDLGRVKGFTWVEGPKVKRLRIVPLQASRSLMALGSSGKSMDFVCRFGKCWRLEAFCGAVALGTLTRSL